MELELRESAVRDRDEAIQSMQKDVLEIHQIFQELAYHVTVQGEQVRGLQLQRSATTRVPSSLRLL